MADAPTELTLDPVGDVPFDEKAYNAVRLKPMKPIVSVPENGYAVSLARQSPVQQLREALARAVEVSASALSIVYEGKELSDNLTLRDNGIVEPGPAAKRRGEKIQLVFELRGDTLPGAVVAAQDAARKAKEEAEEAIRLEQIRIKSQEEAERRAKEDAKRQALEAKRQEDEIQRKLSRAARRQPKSMNSRVRFQCVGVGGELEGRGIVVEMPKEGSVEHFSRQLHEMLGIATEPGLSLCYGTKGRLKGSESLLEAAIGSDSTVHFHEVRDPDEAVKLLPPGPALREISCWPFQNKEEALRVKGNIATKEFMRDFANTGGWTSKPPTEEEQEIPLLTLPQIEGITYVRNQCRDAHMEAVEAMVQRAESLKFTELDFVKALEWVRELAPIIIHVNLSEFGTKLAKDTHYRNQFETNSSKGGLDHPKMRTVEDELFGHAYADATPFERVKYGVLNFANNPRGITSCTGYGKDYFVLKRVRLRTTLCCDDTWRKTTLGTPDYYAHIFAEYADKEFAAALELARKKKVAKGCEDITNGQYKEVQIHGEIRLQDHIAKIVVSEEHRRERGFADTLEALKKACGNCEVLWMDVKEDMERASLVPKSLRELRDLRDANATD